MRWRESCLLLAAIAVYCVKGCISPVMIYWFWWFFFLFLNQHGSTDLFAESQPADGKLPALDHRVVRSAASGRAGWQRWRRRRRRLAPFFFPLRVHLFSARLIDSDQVKARRRWNGRKISSEGFFVQPAGQEKGSLCKGNVDVSVCVWRLQKKKQPTSQKCTLAVWIRSPHCKHHHVLVCVMKSSVKWLGKSLVKWMKTASPLSLLFTCFLTEVSHYHNSRLSASDSEINNSVLNMNFELCGRSFCYV